MERCSMHRRRHGPTTRPKQNDQSRATSPDSKEVIGDRDSPGSQWTECGCPRILPVQFCPDRRLLTTLPAAFHPMIAVRKRVI